MLGTGNKGRYSKKAVKSRKMKTKTTTCKVLIYTCQKCKKSHIAKSRRVSKIMFE
jgi:ribosomal protein L44E